MIIKACSPSALSVIEYLSYKIAKSLISIDRTFVASNDLLFNGGCINSLY